MPKNIFFFGLVKLEAREIGEFEMLDKNGIANMQEYGADWRFINNTCNMSHYFQHQPEKQADSNECLSINRLPLQLSGVLCKASNPPYSAKAICALDDHLYHLFGRELAEATMAQRTVIWETALEWCKQQGVDDAKLLQYSIFKLSNVHMKASAYNCAPVYGLSVSCPFFHILFD